MKFACPKCSTRYSIADDKVPPGKVLKFPCKTCGNVVRLRRKEGDAGTAQVLPGDLGIPSAMSQTGDPVETTRIASVSELTKLRNQSTEPTRIGMQAAPQARAAAAAAAAPAPFSEDGGETTRIVSLDQINLLRAAAADDATSVGGPGMNLAGAAQTHAASLPAAPAPVKQTSAEASEWFVLIAGKQRGPMTATQVDGMLAGNEIDKRTFVWKSGMGNWERISAVERFAGTGGASSVSHAPTPAKPVASELSFEESDFSKRLGDELDANDSALLEEDDTQSPFDEKTQLVAQPDSGLGSAQGLAGGGPVMTGKAAEGTDGGGFYKAQTMIVQNPSLLVNASSAAGSDPMDVAGAFDPRPEEKPNRTTQTFVGEDPMEKYQDPQSLGVFDDVSQNILLPDEHSGMTSLQDDPNYLQAPPGESTRVYMATAGIYKKRRNNRIAAVIATVVVLLIAGFIVMDQQGLIVLPGMGAVYDVAGVEDPNVDRALQRTENKLSEEDLDPKKRAQLESMRRRLLDRSAETADEKKAGGKKKKSSAGADTAVADKPDDDPSKMGVKEEPGQGAEQHDMAEQLFGDTRKTETGLKLASPENIQTPNLPDGITPEAIYKVVADNNTSMKLCYAEAQRKAEKLAGKMEVQMTIAPTGDVSSADITTPQFKNSTMGTCTVKRVKTWKFPRFNGDPVTVQFPYVLQQSF